MANPYGSDALRSLNRILQYREQKEGRKVQEALQFMELAQTKSYREAQLGLEEQRLGMAQEAQDFKEIQSQLAMASSANTQFQTNIAEEWIASAGLSDIFNLVPTGNTDVDKIEENVNTLTEKITSKKRRLRGGYTPGFSEERASSIVAALWDFKNTKDPKSIMNLAKSSGEAWNTVLAVTEDPNLEKTFGKSKIASDRKFIESFRSIGARPDFANLSNRAITSLDNQQKILVEQGEMAQGDYVFQSQLDFGEDDDAQAIQQSLNQMTTIAEAQDAADAYEQEYPEGLGGKTKTALGAAGVVGLGYGAGALQRQYGEAYDKYLRDFKEAGKKPSQGGMDYREFEQEYKVKKTKAFTKSGRPTAQFMREAQTAGREATSTRRALRGVQAGFAGAKDWATRWGGKASVSTPVGLLAPVAGRAIGGAIGDEEGAMIGEAAGLTALTGQLIVNKAPQRVKRSFISYVATKFPAIGGKAAAIAMTDSPFLPWADIAALGFTAWEINDLYQEWSAGAE